MGNKSSNNRIKLQSSLRHDDYESLHDTLKIFLLKDIVDICTSYLQLIPKLEFQKGIAAKTVRNFIPYNNFIYLFSDEWTPVSIIDCSTGKNIGNISFDCIPYVFSSKLWLSNPHLMIFINYDTIYKVENHELIKLISDPCIGSVSSATLTPDNKLFLITNKSVHTNSSSHLQCKYTLYRYDVKINKITKIKEFSRELYGWNLLSDRNKLYMYDNTFSRFDNFNILVYDHKYNNIEQKTNFCKHGKYIIMNDHMYVLYKNREEYAPHMHSKPTAIHLVNFKTETNEQTEISGNDIMTDGRKLYVVINKGIGVYSHVYD
jgi:hypothetical protein